MSRPPRDQAQLVRDLRLVHRHGAVAIGDRTARVDHVKVIVVGRDAALDLDVTLDDGRDPRISKRILVEKDTTTVRSMILIIY